MQELKNLFEQQPTNIIKQIHPDDVMYVPNGDAHYYGVGYSALKCVKLAMLAASKSDLNAILDFPCGHGRVLRNFKAAFPNAEITACDLDKKAVDCCAELFSAIPFYSKQKPEEIKIDRQFDLIWCGSLLTHLDSKYWLGFLKFFYEHLTKGGIVVFSVHGRYVAECFKNGHNYGLPSHKVTSLLNDYQRQGFGYQDYDGAANYGISVSSSAWVHSHLEALPNLRKLLYLEKGWDNHHDIVACERVSG